MTERDVVRAALEHRPPAHVPWNLGFTFEAAQKLREHHGTDDLDPVLRNHIVTIGGMGERSTDIGEGRVRDAFGVVWDRSVDKDIGNVSNCVLPEPTLAGYEWPDPHAARPAGPDRTQPSPGGPSASAFSPSASASTSAHGRCGAWRT